MVEKKNRSAWVPHGLKMLFFGLRLILFFGFSSVALDIFHEGAGIFVDDNEVPLLVENGKSAIQMQFLFTPKNISVPLKQSINHTRGPRVCDDYEEMVKLVDQGNQNLLDYVIETLENIAHDSRIKSRSRKGAMLIATAAAAIGSLASGVTTGILDRLWPNQETKEVRQKLGQMSERIDLISTHLNTNSMELCVLRTDVFAEKLANYVQAVKTNIDIQAKQVILDLLSQELSFENKIQACSQVNTELNFADCALLAKSRSFRLELLSIETTSSGGFILIQVYVPKASVFSHGKKVFSVGTPKIVDNRYFVQKPLTPDFITTNNQTYSGNFTDNLVDVLSLKRGNISEYGCLEGKSVCPVSLIEVYESYLINNIDDQIVVTNFVECFFRYEDTEFGPKTQTLVVGSHILRHKEGRLSCGNEFMDFTPSFINEKVVIDNLELELTVVSGDPFMAGSILSENHPWEKVHIAHGLSARDIVIPCFSVFTFIVIYVAIKVVCATKKTVKYTLGSTTPV